MQNVEHLKYEFWNSRREFYEIKENESGINTFEGLKKAFESSKSENGIVSMETRNLSYSNWEISIIPGNNCRIFIQPYTLTAGYNILFNIDEKKTENSRLYTNQNSIGLNIRTKDAFTTVKRICKDVTEQWDNFLKIPIEYEKKLKMIEIAQKSMKALLESELNEFNHPWNLKFEGEISALMEIKLSHKRNLKIRIGYKNFLEKVKNLKNFIANLEKLENDNNLHMVIEYYGNNQEWENE